MCSGASVAGERLNAAGWVAIAPDLLSGMTPDGKPARNLAMGAAGGMINKLPPDQITADLNACVDYVKGLPSCNGKVAVVEFSWGGSQCFRFATNRKDLAAAFVFYGSGPDAADMPRIQAPVYGFYGGNDARIGASVPPTQEQMKAANKVFEPVTYEGAGHGFMRSGEDPSGSEADKKALSVPEVVGLLEAKPELRTVPAEVAEAHGHLRSDRRAPGEDPVERLAGDSQPSAWQTAGRRPAAAGPGRRVAGYLDPAGL